MNVYNYNHLFYFYVTAKLNGVTVAARILNTSQSSLSTQIKTLESSLGKNLFRKVGRRIELTEYGAEMYNYCRRAFSVFDEMADQMAKKKTSMGVRISVGVTVDVDRTFITDALARVTKAYPKDRRPLINLLSLPPAQLSQLLKAGEIDFLLTHTAVSVEGMKVLDSFEYPVGLMAPRDIANANKRRTTDELLNDKNIPYVLVSKFAGFRPELDAYFQRKKINPVCVFESNIISSVVRAAYDGMGATILPTVYVSRELKSGRLVKMNHTSLWRHKLLLLTNPQGLDGGRKSFADHLGEQLKIAADL